MITVHMKDYRTFSGFRLGMHGGFVWLLSHASEKTHGFSRGMRAEDINNNKAIKD